MATKIYLDAGIKNLNDDSKTDKNRNRLFTSFKQA